MARGSRRQAHRLYACLDISFSARLNGMCSVAICHRLVGATAPTESER
jgi:hypothetical protein